MIKKLNVQPLSFHPCKPLQMGSYVKKHTGDDDNLLESKHLLWFGIPKRFYLCISLRPSVPICPSMPLCRHLSQPCLLSKIKGNTTEIRNIIWPIKHLFQWQSVDPVAVTRLTMYYIRPLLFDFVNNSLGLCQWFFTKCNGCSTVCIDNHLTWPHDCTYTIRCVTNTLR